ncbi:MAG: hypothetical protein IAG13_34325, partial [Deltaproteobacteria bacterium]|nr:hypothetical protein [Nannocystaceae bacterium]
LLGAGHPPLHSAGEGSPEAPPVEPPRIEVAQQTAPAPNKRGCAIESPAGLAGGVPLMLLGLLGRRIRRGAKR